MKIKMNKQLKGAVCLTSHSILIWGSQVAQW